MSPFQSWLSRWCLLYIQEAPNQGKIYNVKENLSNNCIGPPSSGECTITNFTSIYVTPRELKQVFD